MPQPPERNDLVSRFSGPNARIEAEGDANLPEREMMPLNSILLADWCHRFRLPETAIDRACELVLDFAGVAIGGAAEEASARGAIEYACHMGGPAAATLLGGGDAKVSAEGAAFAMAVAGHSLEMDDVHNASSLHPAVVVMPAALAVAEEAGSTGRDFLDAVGAGYEVVLRVGEAAGPTALYSRLFHPTAVCGVFGAAAAAGRLMGLTADQFAHALGIAWGFASGNMSFQTEGSWLKRLQVGHAAQAGVQAARLASVGAQGPLHVFEPHGFFQNYAGRFDESLLLPKPGDPLRLMEVSIKPYACCRYNQAPVDLALAFRSEGILPEQIKGIDVRIASTGLRLVGDPIERKQNPSGQVEAQFSLPYSVAVAMVAGAAGHQEYREPWLGDPRVRGLCGRISAGSETGIDAMFPAKWPARMRVTMRDGRVLEKFTSDCLGDPANPLGRGGIAAKFRLLATRTLGPKATDAMERAVAGLPDAPNLSPIAKLFEPGGKLD